MIEFTIASKPDLQFRFKDISPIKLLALQSTIDFNDMSKTESLFSFILENTEVNISGTWLNVKVKDKDVYLPQGIEKDLTVFMEISTIFLDKVIKPVFTKSRG